MTVVPSVWTLNLQRMIMEIRIGKKTVIFQELFVGLAC